MSKPLSEMTNEELWKLFPIMLSEHMPVWKERYEAEKELIAIAIGSANIVRMNHYGSTSVPGLTAKPTIDILMEIAEAAGLDMMKQGMLSIGYLYSPQPKDPPPGMMFMKGYTPRGFEGQVFHVHVRYGGDWDELYFRDYLIRHPEAAYEYGELKKQLLIKYEFDRDGYTEAKGDFIQRITKLARQEL
jgi:GrpB-like predicted nucleotidyltransferase (UPF0157 family)